ncbi:MAG: nicotinate-nucleotide--dimethylbenzimidazole phosphoribosyltransferase [Actinobacteria bacterium 69-20]|jgi:nicotinate-nucleotide--dimethylbenzimidazole phosphoribosyltransferase|nr:nicotinate-nucleotide--dimethylbenzimidazole phosphoribosyltransferase [Actinomycetota bacterium]OJV24458.1 MAG: nicotinate-nucleotide--dimethylbenzimidazole phosphoribosyltransferase [Actinobacteria bacterium 69-20]
MTQFTDACALVRPIDSAGAGAAADARSDRLTKPRGSLGRLETLGTQLAAIARTCPPPVPEHVAVCVFAGDHGVLAQGVSPWPREVTAQMVANFRAGGAAVTVLARQTGAEVVVVDVGVATPIPEPGPQAVSAPGPRHSSDAIAPAPQMLLRRNVRRGTADLATGPAMTREEAYAALDVGAGVAADALAAGAQMLVTGEMGIGNTTPAAALIAALTGAPADDVTGRGTGIDDAMLSHKTEVVRAAVARLATGAGSVADPVTVLAEVGGLEIAALAGLIVGGAAAGVPVLLDGVIAASAALVACALVPDVRGYLIAGHLSAEPGATIALRHLGLEPLLDLGMRLGEGSGATLAIPLVQAAARILREMATFEDADVTEV